MSENNGKEYSKEDIASDSKGCFIIILLLIICITAYEIAKLFAHK